MDGLMSEATELILSPGQKYSLPVSGQQSRWESENVFDLPQSSTDVNSIGLLRLSIASSVKQRYINVQAFDDKTPKPNKSKRYDGSFTKRSNIDVHFLNSKLTHFTNEKSSSVKTGDDLNSFNENANKEDISEKAFTKFLNESEILNTDTQRSSQGNDVQEENGTNSTMSSEEFDASRKTVENGIKLARRQFSDDIFENCSTYDLACPEILLERENESSEYDPKGGSNESISGNSLEASTTLYEGESERSSSSTGFRPEDQFSLSDSFFANVINDDYSCNKSFHNESVCSSVNKKSCSNVSKNSVPKEIDGLDFADISYDKHSGVHLHHTRERKLGKKYRKKLKKNKSKDVTKYECPKCGVSYIVSSDIAARCLHCDFWTSVEPEFLKRGKQVWNTCRVC